MSSIRIVNSLGRAGAIARSASRKTCANPSRCVSAQAIRDPQNASAAANPPPAPAADKPSAWTVPGSDYSKFEGAATFKSLDTDKNGVLSREEVMAGAWRFNMKPEAASALFDRLDTNGDGVLSPTEWAAHAWEHSVGLNMSFSGAESDFAAPRKEDTEGIYATVDLEKALETAGMFNLSAADAAQLFEDLSAKGPIKMFTWQDAAWERSVGKHMSFGGAENDFISTRPEEFANMEHAAPPTHDWLLFPTTINFAGADNDWCAPTAHEIAAADAYQNPSLSWSSPFSDWVGPSKAEQEAPVYETSLSFASPESDWVAPTAAEQQASADAEPHVHLSYAGAESDFCAPYPGELERADERRAKFDSSSLSYAHLSFATPNSDFTGAYQKELTIETKSLTEALAPSNEARVLTSADGRFEIQHVNDAWTRLCGYSNAESRGKTLGMLQGDATDEQAVSELVSLLRQGRSTEAVLVNYDKHGRKFRNHLTTTPIISDETGEITHFLGVLRDIGGADHELLANAQKIIA